MSCLIQADVNRAVEGSRFFDIALSEVVIFVPGLHGSCALTTANSIDYLLEVQGSLTSLRIFLMAHTLPAGVCCFHLCRSIQTKGDSKMKHSLCSLLAVLFFVPAVVVADSNPLTCKVTLLQSSKSLPRTLKPRTEFGEKFSSFSLDLQKNPDEAWLHQNLCVNKKDFRGGSFEGTLCLVIMTARELPSAESAPALYVDVSRQVESSASRGKGLLSGISNKSLGSVHAVIPLATNGATVVYQQSFATNGSRGDLTQLNFECSAS